MTFSLSYQRLVVGEEIKPFGHPDRDLYYSKQFQQANKKGQVNPDLRQYLPKGLSLSEFLLNDTKNNPAAWQYPKYHDVENIHKNSSYNKVSFIECEKLEITMSPQTSKKEIKQFSEFITDKTNKYKSGLPTEYMSVDIQEIQITKEDLQDIVRACREKQADITVARLNLQGTRSKNQLLNYPVRITFGNAIDWIATIRLDIDEIKAGDETVGFEFHRGKIDDSWTNIFSNFPTWVGFNIFTKSIFLNTAIKCLYETETIIPDSVDIETIAVAAGCNLPRIDKFTINLIVTGTAINTMNPYADQTWNIPWAKLPRTFQINAI